MSKAVVWARTRGRVALGRPRRSLAPLAVVTVAAMVFAVLLILVRLRWPPLESAAHGAAARINHLIAGDRTLVTVVKAVTWLGSDGVLWTVIGAAAIGLALRRRWRLAIYMLVTGAGGLGLGPVLQLRARPPRPMGAPPLSPRTGHTFPTGHRPGSIVRSSPALLVFRPAAGIAVAWLLTLGLLVGGGELVTRHGNGNVLGDRTVPHWLASHRTPGLTRWSLILTAAGGTQAILIVSLATCAVFLAVTRRLRPVIYLATLLCGPLGPFLVR